MSDSREGRSSRRNDSVSSMMSFTQETPAWTRQADGSNEASATPSTPRESQMSAHARQSAGFHAQAQGDHMSTPERDDGSLHRAAEDYTPRLTNFQLRPVTSEMSDMDVLYSVYSLLEQLPASSEVDLVDSFQRASNLPPITQDSLAELDVTRIVNNPKLRHDVNFDKELHFRPNLDGSRGKQKLRVADEYWKALVAELELYVAIGTKQLACESQHEMEHWCRMMKASQRRMPGMFEGIKAILKTIVPEKDHMLIEGRLDVEMMMQQISNGAFNIMDFAMWLAALLKAHCAPMRDDWIEQMVKQIRRGAEEGCQKQVILGLRQTLGILEAMKLDIANHQIRHLRVHLIEDTVNFQQRYHLARVHCGRHDVAKARDWFKREAAVVLNDNHYATPMEIFTSAMFRSLVAIGTSSSFPDTFQLDAERLRVLKNDIHVILQTEICCDLLVSLCVPRLQEPTREYLKTTLRRSIQDIVGEERRLSECAGNVAVEIVRLVLQVTGSQMHYDTELTERVEGQLREDLRASSAVYRTRLRWMCIEYLPQLTRSVVENSRLSTLALHEAMLPPISDTALPGQSTADSARSSFEELTRRITHVAVIHWHVWSPMVYNIPAEEHRPNSPPSPSRFGGSAGQASDAGSGSSSPRSSADQNGSATGHPGTAQSASI